jgi:hypothetical protein
MPYVREFGEFRLPDIEAVRSRCEGTLTAREWLFWRVCAGLLAVGGGLTVSCVHKSKMWSVDLSEVTARYCPDGENDRENIVA